MILLVHMLFGAAIGSKIHSLYLAIVLTLAGHYFLDFIPHIEYSIKNLEEKNWRRAFWDFARVFLDIILGLALIYFFSKNQPIIYVCAIVALLPDMVTLLGWILPKKILQMHYRLHEKIHFLKHKKTGAPNNLGARPSTKDKIFSALVSTPFRVFSQVATAIISIILLKT